MSERIRAKCKLTVLLNKSNLILLLSGGGVPAGGGGRKNKFL